VLLRRKLSVLLAVALMMTSVLAFSAPAFADKGGVSHEGSCGLGREGAQTAVEDPESPGATEFALIHPSDAECPGQEE
jgi:hypothetical protein